MASTPSASALSAVLRCRGNIWTRNPPTKRPATSVYSLGLGGGVVRDSPAERSRSKQASTGEAFLQGERVVVGRRLTVEHKAPRVDVKVPRENYSRGFIKSSHPKLSQSPGGARSGVQNALVRQLARTLTSNLPGADKCSQLIHMIGYETYATHVCKIISAQEISELPAGVVKLSITSPCLAESAGQIPSFVLTGWTTLKSTCLSLTALVSDFMFVKLAVLCRSTGSHDDAPQHLLDEKNIRNEALQANGQIHSPTDLISTNSSGQRITEDRPD
ncbi:uncharacterized protein ABDE67_005206 [Symphorus nematophorus]